MKLSRLSKKLSRLSKKLSRLSKWSMLIISLGGAAFLLIIILFINYILPIPDSISEPEPLVINPIINQLANGSGAVNSTTVIQDAILKESENSESDKMAGGAETPIRLKIPKLKVDTLLEQVGLTPQGAVGAPVDILKAAWFKLGARPGEEGSSVIVGHYGYKNGVSAIFNNLAKLHPGDKIYIEDKKSSTTVFIVQKLQIFDKDAKVPAVFTSVEGGAQLNLITCDGSWNKITKSYSERLVVFTSQE